MTVKQLLFKVAVKNCKLNNNLKNYNYENNGTDFVISICPWSTL